MCDMAPYNIVLCVIGHRRVIGYPRAIQARLGLPEERSLDSLSNGYPKTLFKLFNTPSTPNRLLIHICSTQESYRVMGFETVLT